MEDKVNNLDSLFSQRRSENTIYYTVTSGYSDLTEYLTQLRENYIKKEFEYFNWDIFPVWNYKKIKII